MDGVVDAGPDRPREVDANGDLELARACRAREEIPTVLARLRAGARMARLGSVYGHKRRFRVEVALDGISAGGPRRRRGADAGGELGVVRACQAREGIGRFCGPRRGREEDAVADLALVRACETREQVARLLARLRAAAASGNVPLGAAPRGSGGSRASLAVASHGRPDVGCPAVSRRRRGVDGASRSSGTASTNDSLLPQSLEGAFQNGPSRRRLRGKTTVPTPAGVHSSRSRVVAGTSGRGMARHGGINSLPLNCSGADGQAQGNAGAVRRRCSEKQGLRQPEDRPRNRRYDLDFWGQAGGRRKPGKKKGGAAAAAGDERLLAETRRNNEKDSQRCRELLVALDEEELRSRLVASRWNDGGSVKALARDMASGRALDDRWLREAAAAFNVETKRDHKLLRQETVVAAVIAAVRQSRAELKQPASARDEKRRMNLREAWRTAGAIQAAAKRHGCHRANAKLQQLQEALFVRTCPESLRLEVVEEFVEAQGRLPRAGAAGECVP